MKFTNRAWRFAMAAGLAGFSLAGCTQFGPRPWQHDLLARESMKPSTHPLIDEFHDHIYFSKEAATGGRTAAGGGCGCN